MNEVVRPSDANTARDEARWQSSAEAKANRRLVEELRDEIAANSGLRTEHQDWTRANELIDALLELMP